MFYLSKPLTCGLGTKLLGTSLLMLSSLKDPPNPGTVEVKLLIPKQKVKALVSCQKSTRQTMIWIWKMSLAPTCPFRQPLTHFVKWQFSMNNIYSPFYSGNSHFPWIWQMLLIQLRVNFKLVAELAESWEIKPALNTCMTSTHRSTLHLHLWHTGYF